MATIQSENIHPEQISALFWVNFWISLGLGLILVVCAPIFAGFYGRSELTGITIALSFAFLINGLSIQHQALLYRHMSFSSLAILFVLSQSFLAFSIIMAWFGWHYWSLVVANIISTVVATSLSFYFCPWIPGKLRRIAAPGRCSPLVGI